MNDVVNGIVIVLNRKLLESYVRTVSNEQSTSV